VDVAIEATHWALNGSAIGMPDVDWPGKVKGVEDLRGKDRVEVEVSPEEGYEEVIINLVLRLLDNSERGKKITSWLNRRLS